jgi:hypothetical protein
MTTYRQIADRVRQLGGGSVKTCWIAHAKADHGLTRGVAPNRLDPLSRVAPCPATKRPVIERALRDLGVIAA